MPETLPLIAPKGRYMVAAEAGKFHCKPCCDGTHETV